MKSAILIESNKPLIVADIDLPKKLEFGQVLVKVCYSGLCGAQINEIEAVKGTDKFLPHLLGHEGSGVFEKISLIENEKLNINDCLHSKEAFTGFERLN